MAEQEITAVKWGVVIGASLVAAVMDVKSRRIPNLLTGPLFLAGLIYSAVNGDFKGFLEALAATALLASPFVILFILAGGGAGDAKLTGAIGAWLSIREAVISLACILIVGGVLGLIIAIHKKRLKAVFANMFLPLWDIFVAFLCRAGMIKAVKSMGDIKGERLTVPYGVAIFIGVCVAGGIVLL
jgi:Flp pilus assembly protein protease CpaA